ncbi:hypothetical protein STANM309S_02550 [Streptomyces tanashiensis]
MLAYTPRGLGLTFPVPGGGYVDAPFTSGGTIDVAGPLDWADGSTVIDYAVEHFNPSRIAFLGESYGSGISQLVAAHDPAARVDAVVALSTWGDLADSLYQYETRHLGRRWTALIRLSPADRWSGSSTPPPVSALWRTSLAEPDPRPGRGMGHGVRSPRSYVDHDQRPRRSDLRLSNTWHETLFLGRPGSSTYFHGGSPCPSDLNPLDRATRRGPRGVLG